MKTCSFFLLNRFLYLQGPLLSAIVTNLDFFSLSRGLQSLAFSIANPNYCGIQNLGVLPRPQSHSNAILELNFQILQIEYLQKAERNGHFLLLILYHTFPASTLYFFFSSVAFLCQYVKLNDLPNYDSKSLAGQTFLETYFDQ